MCSEALSAVVVDELSNGSEMTMLENTIHKKGHQLADIVQVNSSRYVNTGMSIFVCSKKPIQQ